MQFLPLSAITLSALLLTACGGSLEGDTSTSGSTPAEIPVTTPTPDEDDSTIIDAISGEPSYFTYEGALPAWIAVKGTGGVGRKEAATITFKLVDANGEVIVGEPVTFSLDKSPFGATLLIADGVTNDQGLVNTSVRSGIGTGPIIATATSVNYPKINQVSNNLAVSTGLPDQDSFTLASDVYNVEALNHYYETANITVYLGGLTGNNAVPDGTTVNFLTEGGRISNKDGEGFCVTAKNECSVVWQATKPRPIDGRVTIAAYATGTESFEDTKPSDGTFNDGETYTDISEVFHDINFDRKYDYGEFYVDAKDADGSYSNDFSAGDGKYTGVQCEDASSHCNQGQIYIFDNIELVLSGNEMKCKFSSPNIDLRSGNSVEISVEVSDTKDNIPPFETSIVATANNGVIDGQSTWSVRNSRGTEEKFSIKIKNEAPLNDVTSDSLMFTITTPKGKVSYCSIDVLDNPPPTPTPAP